MKYLILFLVSFQTMALDIGGTPVDRPHGIVLKEKFQIAKMKMADGTEEADLEKILIALVKYLKKLEARIEELETEDAPQDKQ